MTSAWASDKAAPVFDRRYFFPGWDSSLSRLGNAVFQEPEHLLDIGERCRGVIVISHQAVLVVFSVRKAG